MIATVDIASALEDWAVATLPDLQGSYDHAVAEKTQPLPDVAVEVEDARVGTPDASFMHYQLQQMLTRTWTVRVLLMVTPEPSNEASAKLAGYIDALQASILSDQTLGGRVPRVSYETTASFTPPFVQFDDGTRGRVATLSMSIAEPVELE